MRSSFRASLTTFAASVFVIAVVAGAAAQADNPPHMHWMQQWVADHEALLDAKLAGLEAGLKLNPDQEKLWGPFEGAVRDAAHMRMEHMMGRMEMMRGMAHPEMGEEEEAGPGSPVDRLEAMAERMSEAAAAIKKIAETAKPLYASLDDNQKRLFGMLGREMMMLGHGHRHMGAMGEGGPGMMGGHHRGEENNFGGEDNSDEQ